MARCWLVLLLAAGCHEVFDLARPPDAPPSPDAVIDAGIDSPLGMWGLVTGSPALLGRGDDPSLTGDLLELYINSYAGEILRTTRSSLATDWAPPVLVPELNTVLNNTTPEVSADGLTLHFSRDSDLMVSTRGSRTLSWSPPVAVAELNTSSGEASPSMTDDGLVIVFTSSRDKNFDIWMATRSAPGQPWGPPSPIPSVDTPVAESSPFISADGLSLYLGRNGASYDLYVAERASRTDPFPAPVAITEVNSATDEDEDPWVSPDGRHLYFIRNSGGATSQVLHAER